MEFWTNNNNNNNNSRISKNCQNGKSNNKQAYSDFQDAFPNFMRLTEEERREFFETLQAAKIKLEKSGVNVKSKFGTIHDEAWNYLELLNSGGQKKSTDNDVSISSKRETGEPVANDRTDFDLGILTDELNTKCSNGVCRGSIIFGKPFKNETTRNDFFSQENAEVALSVNKTFENLSNEKEVEVKAFIEENKINSQINSRKKLNASLSYEILHEYEGAENMSTYQEQKENVVRIRGRNLKVQVTLTSADNERIRKTFFERTTEEVEIDAVVADDVEKSSVKTPNAAEFEENLKIHKKESFKERMDDPEVEDLLNVEKKDKESLEEIEDEAKDLEREKGKLGTNLTNEKGFEQKEKKSEERWSREKMVELKPPPAKDEEKKTKSKKNSAQDALSLEGEWQLENIVLEDEEEKKFEDHTDSKIIIRKNIKHQNDNKLQTSVSNSSTLQKELSEPHENLGATQQRILTVTTLKKEAESTASSEEQDRDGKDNKQLKVKFAKGPRLQKLKKYQRKRKGSFYKKLQKKDELKAQGKKNSSDSKAESLDEKEVRGEENPEGTSINSCVADKEGVEISRAAESCIVIEKEENKKEEKSSENISNSEPLGNFERGANEGSEEEGKQTAEVSENIRDEVKEWVPPFAPGKVVFVDNNVIEKISNVILDLEKKAKADGVDTENEYLVLLMEHVEYLSTILETMFESRVLHSTMLNPCVKFDEENLAEIEQCLQISSPTTEDDSDSDKQSEGVERLKRSKQTTSSFVRFWTKCFDCKRKKVWKGSCKQ